MTPASLQQQQIAFDQVMAGFFAFMEWCYQVTIGPNERAHLQSMIVARWGDPNVPVKGLVGYICTLWNAVQGQPPHHQDRLRPQAVRIVREMLIQANGRGQVLATLHAILETLRPGCTGVPLAPPAVLPAAAMPAHPAPAIAQQQAAPMGSHPVYANPTPLQPAQPYAMTPMTAAAANPYAPPQPAWPAGPGPAGGPLDPDDVRARLQSETARHQRMSMDLKIEEGRNKMVDKILNSF
jgi:hypothetical protein